MSQDIAAVIQPLVRNGLFENAEEAVKNLLLDYIVHQVEHYRTIIQKFEKKYGMSYQQFNKYLRERARKLSHNHALHQPFMLEEEDALDWKIATEMLESWLGLKEKSRL